MSRRRSRPGLRRAALAAAMVLPLAACGSTESGSKPNTGASSPVPPGTAPPAPRPDAPAVTAAEAVTVVAEVDAARQAAYRAKNQAALAEVTADPILAADVLGWQEKNARMIGGSLPRTPTSVEVVSSAHADHDGARTFLAEVHYGVAPELQRVFRLYVRPAGGERWKLAMQADPMTGAGATANPVTFRAGSVAGTVENVVDGTGLRTAPEDTCRALADDHLAFARLAKPAGDRDATMTRHLIRHDKQQLQPLHQHMHDIGGKLLIEVVLDASVPVPGWRTTDGGALVPCVVEHQLGREANFRDRPIRDDGTTYRRIDTRITTMALLRIPPAGEAGNTGVHAVATHATETDRKTWDD